MVYIHGCMDITDNTDFVSVAEGGADIAALKVSFSSLTMRVIIVNWDGGYAVEEYSVRSIAEKQPAFLCVWVHCLY